MSRLPNISGKKAVKAFSKRGTLRGLIGLAGLTVEEFLELL